MPVTLDHIHEGFAGEIVCLNCGKSESLLSLDDPEAVKNAFIGVHAACGKPEFPKGFTCASCGKFTRYDAWVYAHWQELLTATCPACGKKYTLRAGRVSPVKGA